MSREEMTKVSKMEELDYQLNFYELSDPASRFEIPVTHQRAIEITKMFLKLNSKGVFDNGWLRMWITASLPIKSAIQNL